MNFFWMAINFSICLVLMFVLPMAMILYTDDSEDFSETIKFAIKVAIVVAIFHIICVALYMFLVGNAHVPVKHVIKTTMDFVPSKMIMTDPNIDVYFKATTIERNFIRIKLGILNCCTLHLTVIGSLLLIFLGGYGLALFPMEFLNGFLNRPQLVRPSLTTERC